MSKSFNVEKRSEIQHPPASSGTSLSISKLLALAQIEDVSNFAFRSLEVHNYRLGDEILSCNLNTVNLTKPDCQEEYNCSDFYLICQGRVRLLCQGTDQSREVTALLLEDNETFGADYLFAQTPLPYRAVAASPVQAARIPDTVLTPLLEQLPKLRESLQYQARQREYLIFFRTLTALRSLSSHHLKQLVPYLKEQRIEAGTSLIEATSSQAGHFWLRQGEIRDPHSSSHSPGIGDSWGYPEPTPPDWIAQTDLMVYNLPVEAWETFKALIPAVDPSANTADSAQTTASHEPIATLENRSRRQGVNYLPSVRQKVPLETASAAPPPQVETPVIFPKPLRRHLLDFLDRYPWVEQQSSSDCGVACLAMICRYWGKTFPIHVLREQANVNRSGTSLKSLARAAEGFGFHARPVRASLGRMAEQRNPWIAHWEGMHYVVVYGVKGDRVIVADPAMGKRLLSCQEFQTHWTGYALLLDPTDRLYSTEIKQASLGRYLGALLPYRSLVVQVILFSILIQIFGLITPLFTQIILDKVVVEKSLTTLNVFAIGLLIFGIWNIGLSSVRQYLLSYFSNRLDLTLISGFISHTLMLPLKFFESRRVGDIITRVQENHKIQRFLIQQVVLAWLNFLTGFVYLGLMLYYNWKLTLLVLLLIPPIVLLTLGATPFLRKISREIFKEVADQNSVLVEMLTGIATVKSAAAERELRWRWEDHLTRQINAQFRGQKFGIGLQATSGLINSLGGTLLLWYGATLVIQDQLTIGQFVAFNMMIGYVISPVIALANLWDELQEVLISVERLNDVFEATPEESSQHLLLTLPPIQGNVSLEDVTFRYGEDEDHNALQNISFQVQVGQTIAIVGRSGSGKSTLVKLLEGLYQPNRGRVEIDGHDIRHVSPSSLRSQLGVVPQECFLFSGTILENITLYRSEYTLDQAIEAAKLAEAHSFIQSLPLGYNTKVGERGSTLSGGQRQRIAIARALLSHPQILILDEATSSLDTEAERRFQRNLVQIRRERTTFIIAHRLSTVRNADRILVLDRGVLVEQGTHEELMTLQGLYCHLAQQQLDL
ncbi:MAG: ATP-binding cassette domain-containing protein [Cyanobacteria bacterium RU_5_0]|nr:ATP-binding cassette domain-containing protein [Cyanobacteria bacterium RU_5_0]